MLFHRIIMQHVARSSIRTCITLFYYQDVIFHKSVQQPCYIYILYYVRHISIVCSVLSYRHRNLTSLKNVFTLLSAYKYYTCARRVKRRRKILDLNVCFTRVFIPAYKYVFIILIMYTSYCVKTQATVAK